MSDESNTLDLTNVPDNDVEEEQEEEEEEEEQAEQPEEEQEEEEEEQAEEEEEQAEEEEEEQEEEQAEEQAEEEEEEEEEEQVVEETVEDVEEEEEQVEEEEEEQAEQSEQSSELTDDLKQRIAELDYLRECCGNWVGSGRAGKRNFLTAWENKNVSVDSNVNYEDTLHQLEKLPEIVKLWAEGKVTNVSNHFKNIQSYTLERSLFNEKSLTEKVEVVEKLIDLLISCANGKMRTNLIEEVIDNLY